MDQLPDHPTSQSPSDMASNADQRSVTSSANNLPPHIQAALARASQQVQSHEPQLSPQAPEWPVVRLPGHSQHQFSPTGVPHHSPPPFSHANSLPYHPHPEQQHHQSYFGPNRFTPTVRLPPTGTQQPHTQHPKVQQAQSQSVQVQQLQSQYPQAQQHQVQQPQVQQPHIQQQPQSRQPYHPHHIQGQSNLSPRQPSNMSAAQAPHHPQFGQHGLDDNGTRRLPLLNRQLYDPGPSGGGYQPQSSHSHQQKSNEIALKAQGKYLGYIAPKIIRDASITTDELKTKERFRQALQKTAQGVIADFATQTISITVNTKGIRLSCYGSLANGFALKNSDMDLLLVLPPDIAKKLHDVAPGMQRALEKAFLDLGLGARLLTKTRVPILRVCEKPTYGLYTALKEEREKWEKEGDEPKKSKDAMSLKLDKADPKPAKPAEEAQTLEVQKGKDAENKLEQKAKGRRRKWNKLELNASGAKQDVGGNSKLINSQEKATAANGTKRDVVSESRKIERHEPAATVSDIKPISKHDTPSTGHAALTASAPTLDASDQPQSTSVSSAHSQPLIVDKSHGPLSTRRDVDEVTGDTVNEKAPPIQPISTVASLISKDRPTEHTETTLVQKIPAGDKDSAADDVHLPIASEDVSASRNDPAPPKSPTEPEDKPGHRDTSHLEFPKIGVGIQCDVNFSNYIALHNTELLRCYAGCDDRVRDIGLFVKAWAKIRKINSPYHGTLSSYGYVLMVIHYLVNIAQPPVVPNLQLVYRDPPPHLVKEEVRTVDGCNVRFWRDENEIQRYRQRGMITKNNQSLGSLLRGFFAYFASQGTFRQRGFNWTQDIISLRTQGGLLPKRAKGWTEAKTTESGVKLRYLFAIEDPFELDHNIARTVVHGGIVAIRDEFRRANKILSRIEDVPGCGWQWRDDDGSVGEDLFTEVEDRLDLQKPRFKRENESKKPDAETSTDPKVSNEKSSKLPYLDPKDEQQVPMNSKQSGKGSRRGQHQKGIANNLKTKFQPEQHPKEQAKTQPMATKRDSPAEEKSKSVKEKGKEPDLLLKETQTQLKEALGSGTETRKGLRKARKAKWVERKEKRKAAKLNVESTEQGSGIPIKGEGAEKGAVLQGELSLMTELSGKEQANRARNKRLAERRKAKRAAEREAKHGSAKIVDGVVRPASVHVKNGPATASASQLLKPSSTNAATPSQSQKPRANKKWYPKKGTKPKGGHKTRIAPAGTQPPTTSPATSKSSTSSLNHTTHTSNTSISLPSRVQSSFISTLAPIKFEPITLPPDNVHDYPNDHLSSCHTIRSNGVDGNTVKGEGDAGSDVGNTALSPKETHTLVEELGTEEQALLGMGEMAFALDNEEADEDTTDPDDDEDSGDGDTSDEEEIDVDRESVDNGSDVWLTSLQRIGRGGSRSMEMGYRERRGFMMLTTCI